MHKYSRVNPGAVSKERVAGSLVQLHKYNTKKGTQKAAVEWNAFMSRKLY